MRLPVIRIRYAFLAVAPLVAAVDVLAVGFGAWWATFLVALVAGLLVRGSGAAVGVVVGTLAAWAGAIGWQSGGRAREIADAVAAIALNARDSGTTVLVATGVYALLLALAGLWLGASVRRSVAVDSPGTVPDAAAGNVDTPTIEKETEHV